MAKTASDAMSEGRAPNGRMRSRPGYRGERRSLRSPGRRALLGVFAATAITAAPVASRAAGLLRGAGNIRRVKMHSDRTGEHLDTIYWIDGDYIPEALVEITLFMRDWRTDEIKAIDRRTIDIIGASLILLGTREPYLLLSGYRSPKTNEMLRRRSSGVARNSLHLRGQAADLRHPSRDVAQIARAAATCSGGGVGRYSASNFVHVDCGFVRSWGG